VLLFRSASFVLTPEFLAKCEVDFPALSEPSVFTFFYLTQSSFHFRYIGVYGVLVLLTLVQYFYTAGSSPGYVVDVMRAGSTMHATFVNTATLSKQSNSRNGNISSPTSRAQLQKLTTMTPTSSWAQMVMDLYPPGSSCRYGDC